MDVQKGIDSRLVKWQQRLANSVPGSHAHTSALAMVRQLNKPAVPEEVGFRLDKAAAELKTHMHNSSYLNPPPASWRVPRGQAVDMPRVPVTRYNYGVQSEAISVAEQLEPIRYAHRDHVHWAMPEVKQAEARVGAGKLFFAPLGADPAWPEGWTELGYTTEGYEFSADCGPLLEVTVDERLLKALGFKADEILSIDQRTDMLKSATLELALEMLDNNPNLEGTAKMLTSNATPDQLEQAALNLAAQAQAIRTFDATEPTGEEPTISFTHTYNDQPGGYGTNRDRKAYTFVGFKCNGEGGTDQWYLTGPKAQGRGYTWRELGATFPAIATGEFLVVTKWGQGK